jgi:hypothetical protein
VIPMNPSNTPLLAGIVLVGAMGVAHGIVTDRWQPSDALRNATTQLEQVPGEFGDWIGEDVPYSVEDMARGGVSQCINRRYRNSKTKATVSVLLVCGRGGPICAHSPEICYVAAGYESVSSSVVKEFPGGDRADIFREARYMKPGAIVPIQLEIYWAWSRDGQAWDAPENPRLTFARYSAVYKLYVVRESSPTSRAGSGDPCQDFLRRALPELHRAFTPQNPSPNVTIPASS